MAIDVHLRDGISQLKRALIEIEQDIVDSRQTFDESIRVMETEIVQYSDLVRSKDQELNASTDDSRKARIRTETSELNNQIADIKRQIQELRTKNDRQNSHRDEIRKKIERIVQELERTNSNLDPR